MLGLKACATSIQQGKYLFFLNVLLIFILSALVFCQNVCLCESELEARVESCAGPQVKQKQVSP